MALEKQQLPVQHWDAILIPIILQKLDEKKVHEWEIKHTYIQQVTYCLL